MDYKAAQVARFCIPALCGKWVVAYGFFSLRRIALRLISQILANADKPTKALTKRN
jgi:hypothetical protein